MWKPTPEKVGQLIREGFGSGFGGHYKAWLRLKRGYFIPKSTHGWYICPWTGRQLEVFSQNERVALAAARFAGAIETLEQKPAWPYAHAHPLTGTPYVSRDIELPSSPGTIEIAHQLGIRHSRYRASTAIWVTTTDLLAAFPRDGDRPVVTAIHAKPSKNVRGERFDQRPAELAEIERRANEEMGNRFLVWDEMVVPKTLARNLVAYFPFAHLVGLGGSEDDVYRFAEFATTRLQNHSVSNLLDSWSRHTGFPLERSTAMFKSVAFRQLLPIDLSCPIVHSYPAPLWGIEPLQQLRNIFTGPPR